MKVRMFEGQYEDNNQTVVFPIQFPMEEMTDYFSQDPYVGPYITLKDHQQLEAWAEAAFFEWGIYDMEIPEGAIVESFEPGSGPSSLECSACGNQDSFYRVNTVREEALYDGQGEFLKVRAAETVDAEAFICDSCDNTASSPESIEPEPRA